jgi:glycosyltransferase involved in cell wall biosynthesis
MRSYEHLAYRDRLFDEIDASPVRDNIEVFRGQFPQKTFDYIISASDVIVFPYSAGAQSGVMANAFAFGKPVVTSALPAFKSIIAKAGCGFTAETDSEYVEYISKLLVDTEIYRSFSGNARKYVEENISWDIVVNRHIEIYRNFDSVRNFNSRYIYID